MSWSHFLIFRSVSSQSTSWMRSTDISNESYAPINLGFHQHCFFLFCFLPWENAAWKCVLSRIEMDSFMRLFCLGLRNHTTWKYLLPGERKNIFQDAEVDSCAFCQSQIIIFIFLVYMHLNIIFKQMSQIFKYAWIIQLIQGKKKYCDSRFCAW